MAMITHARFRGNVDWVLDQFSVKFTANIINSAKDREKNLHVNVYYDIYDGRADLIMIHLLWTDMMLMLGLIIEIHVWEQCSWFGVHFFLHTRQDISCSWNHTTIVTTQLSWRLHSSRPKLIAPRHLDQRYQLLPDLYRWNKQLEWLEPTFPTWASWCKRRGYMSPLQSWRSGWTTIRQTPTGQTSSQRFNDLYDLSLLLESSANVEPISSWDHGT